MNGLSIRSVVAFICTFLRLFIRSKPTMGWIVMSPGTREEGMDLIVQNVPFGDEPGRPRVVESIVSMHQHYKIMLDHPESLSGKDR